MTQKLTDLPDVPGEFLRPHQHFHVVPPSSEDSCIRNFDLLKRYPVRHSMFSYDLGPRAKYKGLLDEPQVKRWYENLKRGSLVTADNCMRRIGLFSQRFNVTPMSLLKMDGQLLSSFVMDAVTHMENEKFSGAYILSHLKALKSWLKFNGISLTVPIKVSGSDDTPTLSKECTPTQGELKHIFDCSSLDTHACAALIAFSGVRPQVIGNYRGLDGLTIEDFPDLEVNNEDKRVTFKRIPTLIKVRKTISKTRHQYYTFLCEEGCRILKSYWESRMREGEILTPESAAVKAHWDGKRTRFLWAVRVSDKVRRALRAAGFNWRPYVLRCYFEMQMMIAERKGYLIKDYRVFWMGHRGDISARYSINKGELPPHVVQDMWESYRKAQKYLQTEAPTEDTDLRVEFRKTILQTIGYPEAELKTFKLEELNEEEFQTKIREKLVQKNTGNGNGNHTVKNKIVPIDRLESYFKQGWEFVAQLPNKKAVIKIADDRNEDDE